MYVELSGRQARSCVVSEYRPMRFAAMPVARPLTSPRLFEMYCVVGAVR